MLSSQTMLSKNYVINIEKEKGNLRVVQKMWRQGRQMDLLDQSQMKADYFQKQKKNSVEPQN